MLAPGYPRIGAEPGKPRPGFGDSPFAVTLAAGLLEIVDDGGVGEGRVSPRSSSPSATPRRTRRMILPLLVFGRSGVKMTSSGLACGPMAFLT